MPRDGFSETVIQLRAARTGDRTALSELLARYLPWVRQTAALRLGRPRRDCHELDDIVQETLLDMFRGIEAFEPTSDGSFRHWLACVVVNNVRDAARQRGRQARRALSGQSALSPTDATSLRLPAHDGSPSQMAQANELEERIERALLCLTPTHREAIIMRDRCGMSYAEIAAQLQFKNADTARALCSRALARLHEQLGSTESA